MQPISLVKLLAEYTGPDNYLAYSIVPFQKKHVLGYEDIFRRPFECQRNQLNQWYGKEEFVYTPSGRAALAAALGDLKLKPEDEVWIETTSNSAYVSGCVTREIEKICRWSRKASANTKVILLIHEFGFPIDDIETYLSYGFPIIEDCAYSLLSNNATGSVGLYADYIVISLPKVLPVPFGGGLYSNRTVTTQDFYGAEALAQLAEYYMVDYQGIREARRRNYRWLSEYFLSRGFEARFALADHHSPGVFLFSNELDESSAGHLRERMNKVGIQSSVFYGERTYFIPCHQELDAFDLEYIAEKTISAIRGAR